MKTKKAAVSRTNNKKASVKSAGVSRKSSSKKKNSPLSFNVKAIAAVVLILVLSIAILGGNDKKSQVGNLTSNDTVAAEGNGSFALEPSNSTVNNGETFDVKVYADTGKEEVNVVQGNLKYPTENVEFVSISDEGSGFKSSAQAVGGEGMVKVARYVEPGTSVSGRQLVATVTFRAKAPGTAAIEVAEDSQIVRSNDSVDILSASLANADITIN